MGGTLRELGYPRDQRSSRVFWNPSAGVELVLHVDDFLVVGEEQALEDLKERLKAVYELKATIIGEGQSRPKGRNLSRVVLFVGRSGVWSWRANEKHVQELWRCTGMETCKPVNSPMTAEDFKDDDRKKTEAQLKVFAAGRRKTVSPRHRARSLHVAGPPRTSVQQLVSSPRGCRNQLSTAGKG